MGSRGRDEHRQERFGREPWLAAAGTMACVFLVALALIAVLTSWGGGTAFAWMAPSSQTTVFRAEAPVEEAPNFVSDEPDVRQIAVQSGDTLTGILIEAGASPDEAHDAVSALSSVYDAESLREGQTVTVTFGDPVPGVETSTPPLLTIAIKPSVERDVTVTRNLDGSFGAHEVVKPLKATDARARGRIEGSLYLSAKAAGVPESVIVDLIRIYSYDVDFQREIKSGDKFDVLYTRYLDENGEPVKGGAIQYAELTLGRTHKPLYRFTTGDDKATDYFTPKGWSGKRALMRTPIDGARLTSRYGLRRHPILGYTKMHKGADFGAPSGTPVMAAGNGTVEMAKWYGGYGRYVRLKHVNAYGTAYAHLSRFARGIKPGAKVRQGQVIGYVGTSGRSTGPHLHYEVLLKAKQVNPMGVKIPTGRNLAGADLAAFQADVTRITTLLATMPHGPELVADRTPIQAATRP